MCQGDPIWACILNGIIGLQEIKEKQLTWFFLKEDLFYTEKNKSTKIIHTYILYNMLY